MTTVPENENLTSVFSSDLAANGAATTRRGRLFLVVQPRERSSDPEVVAVRDGKPFAYPDEKSTEHAGTSFVGANSIRVGPDGFLWVVDRGAPGMGKR